MDSRLRGVAETLVEDGLELESGDDVVVTAPPVAEPLVEALHGVLGAVGASPLWVARSDRITGAHLRALDPDDASPDGHWGAAIEAADATVAIRGSVNATEHAEVPRETLQAVHAVTEMGWDHLSEARSVLTQYPGPGDAQRAGMSTAAYREFVLDAIDRDWAAQGERQQPVADALDAGDRLRIVRGEDTDLTMSIAGMDAVNDDGKLNLPGGEVYTAPVADTLEGHATFDVPRLVEGTELDGVELGFEDGEVVDAAAETGERFLYGILQADDGASRVGEVGIGTNEGIDRVTRNVLFDEKLYGTVHLALGRGYEDCVPEGLERNESTIHQDLIVDTREDGRVEVDGEPIIVDADIVV